MNMQELNERTSSFSSISDALDTADAMFAVMKRGENVPVWGTHLVSLASGYRAVKKQNHFTKNHQRMQKVA